MHEEERFEKLNIPENNSEIPKPETPETLKTELAEGLEKDPRFEAIKKELIEHWKQSTGKDIFSPEGQDFLFGDPTAWKRGERPITIEERAQRVFAERFPEDAKRYAEKEKTRVYENPADDPAIKEVEETIIRITNRKVKQIEEGMWGEAAAKRASGMGYGDTWREVFIMEEMRAWDNFLWQYPEKAQAYRDTFEPIKRAFEGQERLRQYREQRESEERERIKIKTLKHLDIAALYGLEVAKTEKSQEATTETPETAQQAEAEEKIEVKVEPSRPEKIFAQRIEDYERIKKLLEGLGQKTEQKSEQKQGQDIFSIFSSLQEPHRFEIDRGTINQRTFEVKPGRESAIVIETDYHGNYRRWEIKQDGTITLIESGYSYREIDDPAGRFIVPEFRTIKRSAQEARTELEKLLKKFAEQIRNKLKKR
jgi:hypothetical protein